MSMHMQYILCSNVGYLVTQIYWITFQLRITRAVGAGFHENAKNVFLCLILLSGGLMDYCCIIRTRTRVAHPCLMTNSHFN